MLLLVVSCGSPKETVKIYMWAGYPQDIYDDFKAETGITVIEDAVSSNEEIYAKIKSSGGGYDIITPSFDYAEIIMNEGLAYPIDKEKVPNIANIDPNIMEHVYTIDKNGEYIIPFAFGPTLIMYDKTKVSNNVLGYEIFSNPAYKGKISLLHDMREVIGAALLSLGYNIDETNAQAMQDLTDLLQVWKSNALRFDADSYHTAYANGEVDIVHGYPGAVIPALTQEKLANTVFVVPNKGAMMWADNFMILKDAPNKEGAMKLINFMHRPDIYARIMDYINSVSLNVPARDIMTTQAPFSYDDLAKAEMLKAVSDETLQLHSKIWENMLAQ